MMGSQMNTEQQDYLVCQEGKVRLGTEEHQSVSSCYESVIVHFLENVIEFVQLIANTLGGMHFVAHLL